MSSLSYSAVMKLSFAVLGVLVLGFGGCKKAEQLSADVPEAVADAVYNNGKIYTVNGAQPWAEAVAVRDGRFLKVGTTEEVGALVGEKTRVVDLEGRFVMPGIIDLHTHPFITPWYGSMNLSLSDPGDPDQILKDLKAYANANPDKEWILAGQWNIGMYPEDAPRKEWLDEIIPDRPVAVLDQSGHTFWVNSKALELGGIDRDTPSSVKSVVVKDSKTGEPTGTLREQAMQRIEIVVPQAGVVEYARTIYEIFEMFLSYGITSQQTAEGHRVPLDALKLLEREGYLRERVFVSWDWRTTLNLAYSLDDMKSQIEGRESYASDLIYPSYVKIFADGSPMAHTSLLLEPYADQPDNRGGTTMTFEEFRDDFIMFDKMGVGLHVHALGDGTIRRVVDALEAMKEANGNSGVRHKVAHAWMLTTNDIGRLARLKDVNIDFSAQIPYPLPAVEATVKPAVGADRYSKMFPVKTALESGLHVGQGSDWLTARPTPNPMPGIEGFVTRMNPENHDLGRLNPKEAVTLEQAVAITTLHSAHVLGAEGDLGSIEEGKFADMIVLDRNLFDIEPTDISDTRVLRTIVGGDIVYSRLVHGD